MPDADKLYMRRALELAKLGWGDTAPNPMVGAVLVKNGVIIGEGWHARDGFPHAERECLKNAVEPPEGATMYVTLEPCSTKGRTGACTDAIIEAKISEVKIGALDPNPAHSGRALRIFKECGVECSHGILAEECERLNFIFNYSIRKRRAIAAIKYAVSSDGKIAERRGVHTRITGPEARADVMKWRRLFSSVGVGYGTLTSDNPALTSRGFGGADRCAARIIFDASLRVAEIDDLQKFQVFSDGFAAKTQVFCDVHADHRRFCRLAEKGVNVKQMHFDKSEAPEFWDEVKSRLYLDGISSLYIEGGAEVFASLCRAKAADVAFEYVSPKVLGENALPAFDRKYFDIMPWEQKTLGADKLRFGEIEWIR